MVVARSQRLLRIGVLFFGLGLVILLYVQNGTADPPQVIFQELRNEKKSSASPDVHTGVESKSSSVTVLPAEITQDSHHVTSSNLPATSGNPLSMLPMQIAPDVISQGTLEINSLSAAAPPVKTNPDDTHMVGLQSIETSPLNSPNVAATSVKMIPDDHSVSAPDFERADSEGLLFELKNSYTTLMPLYDGYPWKFIVEPHRTTTLAVADIVTTQAGYIYSWKVDGQTIGEGMSITHKFTTRWYARSYVVTLTEKTQDRSQTREFESEVMCKYVRREIRSLSHEDRETYFNTHLILQQVSEVDGKALYGSKYQTKDYFNRKHAGLPGCSAYHKGAQFIGTHMALTLEFEQVLQAIDPSISVPYWDWTIDDAALGQDWRASVVFDGDWFGSAAPDDADSVVTEGRWAYTPILTQAWNYSLKTNPYGYMTDAWNMIKKPYMSRSAKIFGVTNTQPLPTCGDHYMCLTIDNWMDFTDCIENYAHENVHQLLGGVSHSEHTLERLLGKHPEYRKLFLWLASRADRVIMSLHTKQVMQCPDICAIDTPFESCKCSCPSLEEAIDRDTLDYLRDDLGVFTYLSYRESIEPIREAILANKTEVASLSSMQSSVSESGMADIDSIHEMMELYCNPGMIGDQYTSFATNDPVFWPIHPTLERLWHLKRLVAHETFDETWEDVDGCIGHNLHDIHPFKNLVGETSRHHYSNKDLYDLLDPRNPDLPYLYDNYEWDHCSEKGLDLKSAPSTPGNAGMYQSFTTYSVREEILEDPNYVPREDQKNSASQVRVTSR